MTQIMNIAQDVETILKELVELRSIGQGHLVVIGTSTSEVMGKHIGSSGAINAAMEIYKGIETVRAQYGFDLAFQCCEHLNRALVVNRSLLQHISLVEVSAIPVVKAGGSMAAYAYRQLENPCLVENIQADAGLDIGDTLIGMHLRPVAVPFRPSLKQVGQAHVTAAYSRPKLIGGPRAVYTTEAIENINDSNHCQ